MSLAVSRPDAHTVRIQLDRPDALNAMSRELLGKLETTIRDLSLDTTVRAMILTGTGRSFSTGADLKERATMNPTEVRDFLNRIGVLFAAIEALPFPTICAINGFAFGGGLELALTCDFRLAASDATLGLTETSLGIIPGAGGTQRLTKLIGAAKSKLLVFTARKISASDALKLGIVEEVVEPNDLDAAALRLAGEIAKNAPIAVRQAKFAINAAASVDLATGLTVERNAYEITIPTKDRVEALQAFREKRKPQFTGE
ncbi:MAG: enoyl-CoA hydratase/isomerase family protein [Leptospirales bacterium]|nr:enoyl-CoA hydratase/isomerase family protein [Leptospirales bacterium]